MSGKGRVAIENPSHINVKIETEFKEYVGEIGNGVYVEGIRRLVAFSREFDGKKWIEDKNKLKHDTIVPKAKKDNRVVVTEEMHIKMVELKAEGKNLQQISKEVNVSVMAVYRHLKKDR